MSYWLSLGNTSADMSPKPSIASRKRCMYSFISSRLCQFSKANIERNRNQKLLARKPSLKWSWMVKSSSSSLRLSSRLTTSHCCFLLRPKRVKSASTSPCLCIRRALDQLGSASFTRRYSSSTL
ncbi:hypothetical protein D3C71_1564670 [compost metagenome]